MADVFLSYAREDHERAAAVAKALADSGWSVWWDRKVLAGDTFDDVIERELNASKCVIVLWSTRSVQSEWVKNEAAVAAERNVLVPALIDDVPLPIEFRRRQTAMLVGWANDPSHLGFRSLCEAIESKVGMAASAPRRPAVASTTHAAWSGRTRLAAVGAVVILTASGAWLLGRTDGSSTASPPTTVTATDPDSAAPSPAPSAPSTPPPTATTAEPVVQASSPSKSTVSMSGTWDLYQTFPNNTVLSGTLELTQRGTTFAGEVTWRDHRPGEVVGGTIDGDHVEFVMRYADGVQGLYEGTLRSASRIAGTTKGDGSTAQWSATRQAQ